MKSIIDIHGHLGNINFAPFWQADGDRLVGFFRFRKNFIAKQSVTYKSARVFIFNYRPFVYRYPFCSNTAEIYFFAVGKEPRYKPLSVIRSFQTYKPCKGIEGYKSYVFA